MSTETENQPTGSPEPFRRPVVWGRPPQTVFRAGPLPKGERLPPLPEPPRTPQAGATRLTPGPGILSGSMIPRAAPARPTPAPEPETFAGASDPVAPRADRPDLTVRPLPPAEAEPLTARARLLDPVRTPALRPAPARTPPPDNSDLSVRPMPPLKPAVAALTESTPVRPALVAAGARRAGIGRTPLYAGAAVAAVAVLGLGGWMMTRSPAATPVEAVPAAAAEGIETAAVPVEATPILEAAAAPAPATPSPARAAARPAAARAAPRRAPVTPTAVAYAPASAPVTTLAPVTTMAPVTPAPTPAITPTPLIEIAPAAPAGPPPTQAEQTPADPDAPIATRPQPIG